MQQALAGGPGPAATARIIDEAIAAGNSALDEHSAKALLRELGIRVPHGVRLAPGQAAASALAGLNPPFALKALSNEALHKSDIGAVRLGLSDAAAVEACCTEIRQRMEASGKDLTGFLVEEMAAPGVEIVIGGVKDPQLGPMIMIGAGGVFAEILNDVSFRLCPIDAQDAHEMIDELKISPILHGVRGKPAVDIDSICVALLALGGQDGFFVTHDAQVAEFDLNPLIARPNGLTAVDCRIVLAGDSR
jgi:acetyl-CoA synthetase (ADP-forming)